MPRLKAIWGLDPDQELADFNRPMYHYYHHADWCVGKYLHDSKIACDAQGVKHEMVKISETTQRTKCMRLSWEGSGKFISCLSYYTVDCQDCLDTIDRHIVWQTIKLSPTPGRYVNQILNSPPLITDPHSSCNDLAMVLQNALDSARDQLVTVQENLNNERRITENQRVIIGELKTYIRGHGLLVPGEPAEVLEDRYPLNIEIKK